MIEKLLRLHEGLSSKPYRDTVGKLTIGVGRNLDDVGISKEEADMMLANDIARAKSDLSELAPWDAGLDEVRQAVLIDMCFNLGKNGLSKFKRFLAAMQDGDWRRAAQEMRDSLWWAQVGSRAVRLERMVLDGRWPEGL